MSLIPEQPNPYRPENKIHDLPSSNGLSPSAYSLPERWKKEGNEFRATAAMMTDSEAADAYELRADVLIQCAEDLEKDAAECRWDTDGDGDCHLCVRYGGCHPDFYESAPTSRAERGRHWLPRLARAINDCWIGLYGGKPVSETDALILRVEKITEDRNCWMENAKANQKEYLRLERECQPSANESNYDELIARTSKTPCNHCKPEGRVFHEVGKECPFYTENDQDIPPR